MKPGDMVMAPMKNSYLWVHSHEHDIRLHSFKLSSEGFTVEPGSLGLIIACFQRYPNVFELLIVFSTGPALAWTWDSNVDIVAKGAHEQTHVSPARADGAANGPRRLNNPATAGDQ